MTSTAEFLLKLMRYWPDQDLRLELRCLGLSHGQRVIGPRRWYPLEPEFIYQAAANAESWSGEWDVYMGVLPRAGECGDAQSVNYASWIFCDVDGGDDGPVAAFNLVKLAVKSGRLPAPHMAVMSGGGAHCYWQIDPCQSLVNDESRLRFRDLLRRLVRCIGGEKTGAHADPSRTDIASILRVPGTFNHKNDHRRPVVLKRFAADDDPIPISWFRANLPAMPAPPAIPVRPVAEFQDVSGKSLPNWVETWIGETVPPGYRHSDLTRVAAKLSRDYGMDRDAIAEVIARKASLIGIPENEVAGIVRWCA